MIYAERILENYNEFFPVSDCQLNFFSNIIQPPAKLLDIECGLGLFANSMTKQGFETTGIDTHKEFISKINNSSSADTNSNFFHLTTFDIARFFSGKKFDLITCLNGRLLFIQDPAILKKFFIDVKVLLNQKGYFVIDLMNFQKLDFQAKENIFPAKNGNNSKLNISLNFNNLNYYLNVATQSETDNKEIDIVTDEISYPFTKQTIETIAKETGFSDIEFFGDYEKTAFDEKTSKRLITVLHL